MSKLISKPVTLGLVLLSLLIGACSLNVDVSVDTEGDLSVYRALARKNATFAKVNDNQFRIDDDGLSTFEAAEFNVPSKQCKLELIVEGVESKPAPGTSGAIRGMAGYRGTYTPEEGGPGHWSIKHPGKTKDEMKADFTAYAIASKLICKNSGYTGSSPSACNTPDAPN